MKDKGLDFSRIKTYSARKRNNLVTVDNVMQPCQRPEGSLLNPAIEEVARAVVKARQCSRPVIWFMGAHVVKRGLSLRHRPHRSWDSHSRCRKRPSQHTFELALSRRNVRACSDCDRGRVLRYVGRDRTVDEHSHQENYSRGLGYGSEPCAL